MTRPYMARFRSNTVVLPLPPHPLAAQGGSRPRNCRSRSRSCKGRHSEWNGHSVPPLDFFYFTYRRSQIDRRTPFPSFSLLTVIGDIRCTEKSRSGRSREGYDILIEAEEVRRIATGFETRKPFIFESAICIWSDGGISLFVDVIGLYGLVRYLCGGSPPPCHAPFVVRRIVPHGLGNPIVCRLSSGIGGRILWHVPDV
jgi:hypothetical protein